MTERPKHEGYRIGAMGRKRAEAGVAEGAGPTRSGVGRGRAGFGGCWGMGRPAIVDPGAAGTLAVKPGPPAPGAAGQDVGVVQPIQEGGDGGGVAEEFTPVLFERRGILEALASSATRPGAARGPAPPA